VIVVVALGLPAREPWPPDGVSSRSSRR